MCLTSNVLGSVYKNTILFVFIHSVTLSWEVDIVLRKKKMSVMLV